VHCSMLAIIDRQRVGRHVTQPLPDGLRGASLLSDLRTERGIVRSVPGDEGQLTKLLRRRIRTGNGEAKAPPSSLDLIPVLGYDPQVRRKEMNGRSPLTQIST
jgi:hypothetical protein